MNESLPSPVPLREPVPKGADRPRDRLARVLAALAIVASTVVAWIALEAFLGVRAIETSMGTRFAELGGEWAQSKAGLALAQAALREAQARIAELEARVADTQGQRVALEEMYRELSRGADERVLAEIEQMLVLASQQLQLAGNVRGALAALQAADQRLARAEKLPAAPLRRAINQDMERLKAVPQLDTVGIALKIDALIAQADTLPLVIAETLPAARVTRYRSPDEAGFARAARDIWDQMRGLVRIRDLETPDVALLSPAQSYFLR
ncbi:MAG TPA: uroporphyrinogen-III C-methyltransferase, partial [Usitatibacter sp.]|nr:uroporphyrinogen-III C-methyltransferase [Usitatibacter sp.]